MVCVVCTHNHQSSWYRAGERRRRWGLKAFQNFQSKLDPDLFALTLLFFLRSYLQPFLFCSTLIYLRFRGFSPPHCNRTQTIIFALSTLYNSTQSRLVNKLSAARGAGPIPPPYGVCIQRFMGGL